MRPQSLLVAQDDVTADERNEVVEELGGQALGGHAAGRMRSKCRAPLGKIRGADVRLGSRFRAASLIHGTLAVTLEVGPDLLRYKPKPGSHSDAR